LPDEDEDGLENDGENLERARERTVSQPASSSFSNCCVITVSAERSFRPLTVSAQLRLEPHELTDDVEPNGAVVEDCPLGSATDLGFAKLLMLAPKGRLVGVFEVAEDLDLVRVELVADRTSLVVARAGFLGPCALAAARLCLATSEIR